MLHLFARAFQALTVPLFCDETGDCARPALAKEGEACEQLDCAAGPACWAGGADVERCQRPAAVGESCESAPCGGRASCDHGICVAERGD